jgi:hypothetical protein
VEDVEAADRQLQQCRTKPVAIGYLHHRVGRDLPPVHQMQHRRERSVRTL